jgi:hypothetical protein
VVVVPETEEGSTLNPVLQRHADEVTVEADRTLQIRDPQVKVTDVGDGFASLMHGVTLSAKASSLSLSKAPPARGVPALSHERVRECSSPVVVTVSGGRDA